MQGRRKREKDEVYINKVFRGISRGGVGGGGREGEREKGEVGVVVIIHNC